MDEGDLQKMGPIDYLVVEFPMSRADFSGDVAKELRSLVDSGQVRVLDLLFINKDAAGSVQAFEASDLDDERVRPLRDIAPDVSELLAEEDIDAISAALEPDTLAAVLVWENAWAVPLALAIRRSGGELVATGRIPVQGILASLEAEKQAVR